MSKFVPRERKHKKLARRASSSSSRRQEPADTNPEEIVPESQTEREARRAALKQRLREQQPQDSKITSAKKKRLDKYVDTKLRKEENAELVRKLAAHTVDTTLLRSSKNLGRTRESKKETLRRALKERDMLGIEHEDILLESRRPPPSRGPTTSPASTIEVLPAEHAVLAVGSGLKRPLDVDESGRPVIPKRKRRKVVIPRPIQATAAYDHDPGSSSPCGDEGEEWAGFSDTAKDSELSSPTDSAEEEEEEEDDDQGSDTSLEEEDLSDERPVRISAFKIWANSQQNAATGFTPSSATNLNEMNAAIKANFKPRAPSPDPLMETITASAPTVNSLPAEAITIPRSEETQKVRLELPIVQEEQKIIETISNNPVTIICGATGSGKTTQVPQMLFESGYGSLIGSSSASKNLQGRRMIGITQPRRVAATSVADRVAHELGSGYSKRVAHQVRYDTTVSRDTAIKFMTDGVLLREIQTDFPLEKYSCIIIDEAHERSVNTDVLIGLLSRIIPLRTKLAADQPNKFCPLKLVIMSATLRVRDLLQNERLFREIMPPIVDVEGRQYTVDEHFARKTKRDYVAEMIEKVARGHRKLPPGGMLVFLTGQEEILFVARSLRQKLMGSINESRANSYAANDRSIDDFDEEDMIPFSDEQMMAITEEDGDDSGSDVEVDIDGHDNDNEFAIDDNTPDKVNRAPLIPHILTLYAALPASQQQKVFQDPPEGHRQIILSTNVAETSVTIPGIRYVFDCGRSKAQRYDQSTGVQTFEVGWISKASAAQRKGRAGRTGPGGHVWRLYSSAVYERDFEEYTVPEILRTPLESLVLQVRGYGFEHVANFPLPTAPERVQLLKAETLLKNIGAISSQGISETGREIMKFPVSPRAGKILMLARKNGVLIHAIALAAALSVGDLYIAEAQSQSADRDGMIEQDNVDDVDGKLHQAYTRAQATLSKWDNSSDVMKLLKAVAGHADALSKGTEEARKFCKDFFLREKGLQEVQQLRRQLHIIAKSHSTAYIPGFELGVPIPTEKERIALNQIVVASYIDQVAVRADTLKDNTISFGRKARQATEVAYRILVPIVSEEDIDRRATPVDQEFQRSVFIHPSSILSHFGAKDMPQYIAYSHLSKATPSAIDGNAKRTRMHPLAVVGPKALATLAEGTPLLQYGKPILKIEELLDRRRRCWVDVSLRAPEESGNGWHLARWKVVQKKGTRGEWITDQVLAR